MAYAQPHTFFLSLGRVESPFLDFLISRPTVHFKEVILSARLRSLLQCQGFVMCFAFSNLH